METIINGVHLDTAKSTSVGKIDWESIDDKRERFIATETLWRGKNGTFFTTKLLPPGSKHESKHEAAFALLTPEKALERAQAMHVDVNGLLRFFGNIIVEG